MSENSNIPFNAQPPDFKASVRLLTAEEGGRNSEVVVGYRPQVWFDLPIKEIYCTSGSWQKMDKEKLFPGDVAEIEIALLAKGFYKNQLFSGLKFQLTEGSVQIGTGEILEVYNHELKA